MTDRSMNYELDGIFASRGQGQLITSQPEQQRMIRTPGLVPMKKNALAGYVDAPSYAGTSGMGGWLDDTTTLPMIGTVSNKMLLAGGAAIALAAYFFLKRK